MEAFIVAFLILGLGVIFGGFICGIAALVKVSALRREMGEVRRALARVGTPIPPRSPAAPAPRTAAAPAAPPPLPVSPPPIASPTKPPPPTSPPPPPPAWGTRAGQDFRAALRREIDDVRRGLGKIGIAPAQQDRPEAPPAEAPAGEKTAESPIAGRQDWETRVGQRWMTWAGGLILFLGAAFFVKYAFENQWIGPTGRVTLGMALGIALLLSGQRFARRGYRALAQGVMGSGLAILYVSAFAAFSLYKLLPQSAAFAVMVLFAVLGMALAIAHDALSMAVLATLGGLLTPVLVSTGRDARDALFAYLTVLNLGVLGVAFFRRWRALDALAFLGTISLYIGWFAEFYQPAALIPALLWLGGFYLIFLALPFVYYLRRAETAPVERFVMALANATFAFGYSYYMLQAEHRQALGFIALGIASANVVMGSLSRVRLKSDGRQVLGFLGMAVAFLTIAAPLHLKLDGITLAWAIEAPVLLFLGYRYRYSPLRWMAAAVLLLAGFRAFAWSFPNHGALFIPIFNPIFGTAIAIPAAAAVFAWIHKRNESDRPLAADRAIMNFTSCAAGVAALVFLTAEMSQWFQRAGAAAGAAAWYERYAVGFRIVLWTVGALIFLTVGLRARSRWSRAAGFLVLAVSAGLALHSLGYYRDEPYRIFLNVRFLAVLFQIAGVFAWAWLMKRFADRCREDELRLRLPLIGAAMLLLLALISVEAYNFSFELAANVQDARWMSLGAVSVAWGLYAVAILVIGFRRGLRWLRYAALGLF
ncbi:MAG: DUF2339 domain-containing protein, partial [Candidatus Aureabacteria bacterium]|nr:DUF2339 domain-containing protein [Candidatus Auribacterota bacterium]